MRKLAVKTDLPEIIPAPGLDSKRQWYLFHQIRDFCSEDAKDLVCPKPTDPEPSAQEQEPKPGPSSSARENKSVQKLQSKASRPNVVPKRPYKQRTAGESDSEEVESEARKVVAITATTSSGQKTRSGRQVPPKC